MPAPGGSAFGIRWPRWWPVVALSDFSGGWNCRDAPSELAPNESPDLFNVSLDQRGDAVKRLGVTRLNATPRASAADVVFYSAVLDMFLIQRGTTLEKTTDWTTFTGAGYTPSSSARGMFCDFHGEVVYVHPVDGVYTTTDGSTYTNRSGTAKGTCVAVWQNKVFAGDGNTLWWSNAGDAHTWTTATDFNQFRDKDDSAITALASGPNLLVYKRRSIHRVTSPTTGSYVTISVDGGAAGALATSVIESTYASITDNGIWVTNGISEPTRVSNRISPLFTDSQLNLSNLSKFCAGRFRERFVFSVPRAGSSTNNLTLEYNPAVGWIVPHSFGSACYTNYTKNAALLYDAKAGAGYFRRVFKGWDDEGSVIASRFQTPWLSLRSTCRFFKTTVECRGAFAMYAKPDYTTGVGHLMQVAADPTLTLWNGTQWGRGYWNAATTARTKIFQSTGVGKVCSFQINETSSTQAFAPAFLTDGVTDEVGSWSLQQIVLWGVPLGRT